MTYANGILVTPKHPFRYLPFDMAPLRVWEDSWFVPDYICQRDLGHPQASFQVFNQALNGLRPILHVDCWSSYILMLKFPLRVCPVAPHIGKGDVASICLPGGALQVLQVVHCQLQVCFCPQGHSGACSAGRPSWFPYNFAQRLHFLVIQHLEFSRLSIPWSPMISAAAWEENLDAAGLHACLRSLCLLLHSWLLAYWV